MTKNRECGTKQKHPTKADAEAHLWALVRAGTRRARMSVYHCTHCGSWHVGHTKRRRR